MIGPSRILQNKVIIFATLFTLELLCSSSSSWSVSAFTLITFDVDGTLVHGTGKAADESAHAKAFSYACGKVLGDGGSGGGEPVTPVAEALPRRLFHGSTDGLILCRLAKATLDIEPDITMNKLDNLMNCMYEYISKLSDDEVANGISTLPGVIDNLNQLATMKDSVACGLVTGNVEGIARRKMKAVGILQTGALAPPSQEQLLQWSGSDDIAFLGGFGSDYCSGNIDDLKYNHLDRAEQISIAAKRCRENIINNSSDGSNKKLLRRVVHVGDAPADVLAAKTYSESIRNNDDNDDDSHNNICVGLVAVATGSYSANELRELAGEPIPNQWEPVILENGIADPEFLNACGIFQTTQ